MKVSACMMVKNEEALLPQCLDSIKDWIDEIIIVDTGSTDRTVEIAKSYGAKVYHHHWQNDFSLHRNQSIKYATGDWIFIIDADEVVLSDMTPFKERLKRIPPNISSLVVRLHEVSDGMKNTSWLGIRFFRRSSNVQYKGIVHNKVTFDGGTAATDIEMRHFGYSLPEEKMAKKRNRTEKLLLNRIRKNKNDHAAMYYLCQMKIGQKKYKEAEDWGMRFFRTVTVGPEDFQFYSVMYFFMAWVALQQGDGNKTVAWALKGLEYYPDDLDLNYIMARVGYQSENDEWLVKYGKRYLELAEKRHKEENPNTFVSEIDPVLWANRTIHSDDEKIIKGIKTLLEYV